MSLTAARQSLAIRYAEIAEGQARAFALKTSRGRMSIDDARSAAMFGLVQAIEAYPRYLERNPGFDPSREDYMRAYLLRRIRGAILDDARAADHMTRSDRRAAKVLRQAEDDGAHGTAGLAAAAGIDPAVVRRVRADAVPPASLDDTLVSAERGVLIDEGAGVESEVAARQMLAAVVAAFDRLDAETQVIVALRWHQELPLDVAAKQLGISVERARRLHDAGVREIHQAMLRQVQAEGIGPRQPALPLPPVWVRSGDCRRAGEAGAGCEAVRGLRGASPGGGVQLARPGEGIPGAVLPAVREYPRRCRVQQAAGGGTYCLMA